MTVDRATRATRLAANAAAFSAVLFAALWALTTQVKAVRVGSPFADDPWDAVATYAAIFLPFVAGPTWIRSLRHRAPRLPAATARRIRWGSGLAAGIAFTAAAVDLQAILSVGFPADAGPAAIVIAALVAATLLNSAAAIGLSWRAGSIDAPVEDRPDSTEPDVVDDLLVLATEVAGAIGLRRHVERLAATVERFLDGSPASPRRHRVWFGVVIGLAAAIAFDVWHAIREGSWANPTVPVVFGTLVASGILAIYLGTVGPLRLLRPMPPSSGAIRTGRTPG